MRSASSNARSRDLQGCERDPRCQWERAAKLELEAECAEPTPVGCLAVGTLCTPSIVVAEDSQRDLFILPMGCGNDSYTPLGLRTNRHRAPDNVPSKQVFVESWIHLVLF